MRFLLQFDLASIPRNAVINSARWELFQTQVVPVGDGNMDFRAQFLTQGWSESGVTWNNANFLGGDSLPLGSVPGTIGWQSGDARGVLQAWLSGAQPNFGVIITGDEVPSRGRWRAFRSRETGDAPRLVVDFTTNCDTVPPTATVQALPQFSPGEFRVFWSGQDFAPSGCQPSGIANYDVQYRINGGSWVTWHTHHANRAFWFPQPCAQWRFCRVPCSGYRPCRQRRPVHLGGTGGHDDRFPAAGCHDEPTGAGSELVLVHRRVVGL